MKVQAKSRFALLSRRSAGECLNSDFFPANAPEGVWLSVQFSRGGVQGPPGVARGV